MNIGFYKITNNIINYSKYIRTASLIGCLALGNMLLGQDLLTHQAPLPCLNKKFTVVAHIVKDSFGMTNKTPADINGHFLAVNEIFKPICVSFEVCEFKIIDNFQYDTLFKVSGPKWDELLVKNKQERRINMVFVEHIDTNSMTSVAGFAAGSGIRTNAGGVAIIKGTGPMTIAHELGHYFGLLHTFEGNGIELVDGSNCETEGDQICDTPADPYRPFEPMNQYVDADCRFINTRRDANMQFYRPDVGNIMSYYPCKCGFTYEQYLRMAQIWLNSNRSQW